MTDTAWIFLGLSLVLLIICVAVGSIAAEMHERLHENPPWTQAFSVQLQQVEDNIMAAVQIEQADLDTFAASVESEVAGITAAVGVIGGYIQTLLAGQAVPLPAADETAISTALSDLGAGVGNLQGLEPPVAVDPAPPVDPAPVEAPPAEPAEPTA